MSSKSSRRADIDRLRIFACYLLFLFHVAMVFAPVPFFHIQNAESSAVFAALVGFISLWHMPLFFLLAGWSAFESLHRRGTRRFVVERLLKLALPLAVVCAVFGPMIKFIELSNGFDANYLGLHVSPEMAARFRASVGAEIPLMAPFHESFVEFWPSYFTRLGRFTWSHLWFVAYLFVFSLLYLPLFTRIVRSAARVERLSGGWAYAPILPLGLIQVTLRPHFPGLQTLWNDWANFAFYSVFVLLAAVIVPLALNMWLKFALLLTASVVLTLGAYHFGVRRVRLLRFLSGMKARPVGAGTDAGAQCLEPGYSPPGRG